MTVHTYTSINGEARDTSALKLPNDRSFRDAWKFDGAIVEVDMATARQIHRKRLRAERKPLLQALDSDWFIAAERGDQQQQAEIAAQKQKLRDVTANPRIDAARTAEELSALTLQTLLG